MHIIRDEPMRRILVRGSPTSSNIAALMGIGDVIVDQQSGTRYRWASGGISEDVGEGTGATGPQGPTGPSGPKGADITIGTGAPVTLGASGDLYLDCVSGNLYRCS